MTEPAALPDGLALVSWGRATSGSLSAQVVSGAAHLVRLDEDHRTLCGVAIPRACRPSTPRGFTGILSRVFPDDERETAAQPRCGRCARSKAARP